MDMLKNDESVEVEENNLIKIQLKISLKWLRRG